MRAPARRPPLVRPKDLVRLLALLGLGVLVFMAFRFLLGSIPISAMAAAAFLIWGAFQRPFARLRRHLFRRRKEVWVDENGVGFNDSYYQE